MSSWIVSNLWLIPAVPLAVSLVVLSLANPQRSIAALLAIFGQTVAFILAIMAFLPTLQMPGFRAVHNFTWFTFGDQAVRIGWMLDPLAAVMIVMITLVGLCIFVFSVGYMAGDKNFTRFFAYLSFFSGAMLGVVIANSLLLLFVSWELVGLASYLLIGFWIERPSAAAHRRSRVLSRDALALPQQWHPFVLRPGRRLPRRRGTAGHWRERHFYRAADFLRCGRQIRAIPSSRLAAGCDGRTNTG
jgi:NADH-quinone oxidoreductase subunit L